MDRSIQGTHPSMIPNLYPAKARLAGLEQVMRALVRFLHAYGYYPKVRELTKYMQAHHPSVVWYVNELIAMGYVERAHGKQTTSSLRLTEAGWSAMRLLPIEPWCKRPLDGARRRLLRKVATRIAEAQTWDPGVLAAAVMGDAAPQDPDTPAK